MWEKLCSVASNWCNALNSLTEYWHVKAVLGLVIAYAYQDIKPLVVLALLITFADWIAKLNTLGYEARKQYGDPDIKYPLYGFYLAWKHDLFSVSPMRDKFVPKLFIYVILLGFSGASMTAFKVWGLQDLYIIPQSVIVWIVITELSSIAKHLKSAESPLYGVIAFVLRMYHARQGVATNVPPEEVKPEDLPAGRFYDHTKDNCLPIPPDREARL